MASRSCTSLPSQRCAEEHLSSECLAEAGYVLGIHQPGRPKLQQLHAGNPASVPAAPCGHVDGYSKVRITLLQVFDTCCRLG